MIEGLGRGLFSVGKGVFDGVIGVVETPYKEIKKKGGDGIISGIGQGLFGLVAKPLVGVSDVVTKPMEGLKNNFNVFEDLPNEKRER